MKPRILFLMAVLSILPLFAAPPPKLIMAYYMPWYTAKPYRNNWGWHWTMNHFNPDSIDASGERQIASWYYPLIGPYDSCDPAVLEYHVLLMKLAGVDGVIVDWYGSADYLDYGDNNRATVKLFQYARRAGLKFSICYEDQTIQHLIEANFITANNALTHAQQDMLYLQTNFFADAGYLRLKEKPVLLNFGPQHFTASTNWDEIFSVLEPSNQPAFFTEDNRIPAGSGAFDWPPMWMSQVPGTGGILSVAALRNYLADFDQKAPAWPAFISSAFPRFHDIYQRADVRNFWGYLGDRQGDTLRETLNRGMTNRSALVQIVTWNDFGEGTMVEPTRENGYRDLGIVQESRRQFLEPGFANDTNDLALALRFYQLRQQCQGNATVAAKLDQIFTNLVTGQLRAADTALTELTKPTVP
jgi:hypothetical protein